jgi:hypothetical protein
MAEPAVISDAVTLQFTVDESITSDTVRATLSVSKVISDETAFDLRATLRTVVDVPWEIVTLQRYDDNGLERLNAAATARIPDSEAASLNKKLRDVNKSGLKIEVAALDYSPQRERVEEAKVKLRESIYTLAQQEAGRLNNLVKAEAGDSWRVGSIDFARAEPVLSKAMRATAYSTASVYNPVQMAAASAPGGPAGGGAQEDDPSVDTSY